MISKLYTASGILNLKIFEIATGDLIDEFTGENLVVTNGHTNLAALLGGDIAGKPITKIGLGTNALDTNLTDSSLTAPFYKNISAVSYPSANSVQFYFEINDNEANGKTVTEFGLLTADNVLCARKVRSAITKTSAVRLVGTWKISFNS